MTLDSSVGRKCFFSPKDALRGFAASDGFQLGKQFLIEDLEN